MNSDDKLTQKDLLLVTLNFVATLTGVLVALDLDRAIASAPLSLTYWAFAISGIMFIVIFGVVILTLSKSIKRTKET